jgi:hypothetical protein
MNRGTIYDIAHKLFQKGLLSSTQKGGITYFVAQSPKRLAHSFEEKIAHITQLVPLIESQLQTKNTEPRIQYFEGREGIRAIFEATLDCKKKELLQFASIKEMVSVVGTDFIKHYVKRRVRRHIHIRALKDPAGEMDPLSLEGHSTASDPLRLMETRICSTPIPFPAIIILFDQSVAFISGAQENFGFIIQSASFTATLQHFFELLWLTASTDSPTALSESMTNRPT